ncbi:MAG TPA: peptidylprolyl isomerase [Puia sp.]|jgi:peptidyl-prolyl cis-trans isomerase SurA|nr:peptidylprolyl isomerase [Puia sp.]
MQNPNDIRLLINRALLLFVLFLLFSSGLSAQTLFTVAGTPVSKEEFLKAFSKNNNGVIPSEKIYKDYLELYIRYKLKVKAAYAAQLDTLPAQRTELQNFRSQIAEAYMKDQESMDRLVNEAYARGQKDIRLAHIYFALPKNVSPADTLRVYEKAMTAYNELRKGKKFGEAAIAFSDDPTVKMNRGEIGYITVFSLPYEMESLAYSLAPGQVSRPYRSKGGYHIFKNEGERKAVGRIKVAQILVSFPPGASMVVREQARVKADSIYRVLVAGGDFATLARASSADNLTYQNGGELPEFGIGRYDSAFEAAAFGLDRDGAISRPVVTDFGYHIIKRLSRKPFPARMDDAAMASIRQQVLNDPRVEISRQALYSRIYRETGFQRAAIPEADLWAFTDSALRNPAYSSYGNLSNSTMAFSFSQRAYTIKDWIDFARATRPTRAGSGLSDKDLFQRYIERTAMDYYRNHLEQYNKDFAFQLNEFKEGNLLFEIMQRKIWDKASADSAGLVRYYEAHKGKYWWNTSADALLFTCNNAGTADALKARLMAGPISGWRMSTDSMGAAIQADSGRYELAQIPGSAFGAVAQTFTELTGNKADNTVSFAYILTVYNNREPRSYHDARGFVINDYQGWLEEQWVEGLKKEYPVKVDEQVVAGLVK